MAESDDYTGKLACLSGVFNLRAPGTDSNYLDWEFKMELALEHLGLSYVLQPPLPKDWMAAWNQDNTKASTLTS